MNLTYSKSQDSCRDVEEKNIHDNHIENPFNLPSISDNEVKSRIEHEGLASYHSIPADGNESNGNIVIFPYLKELHEEGQGIQHDPPR